MYNIRIQPGSLRKQAESRRDPALTREPDLDNASVGKIAWNQERWGAYVGRPALLCAGEIPGCRGTEAALATAIVRSIERAAAGQLAAGLDD